MNEEIKTVRWVITVLWVLFLASCAGHKENEETQVRVKVPVTVDSLHVANISDYFELNATSAFLVKSVVRSPLTGYIEDVKVLQGDIVRNNEVLFQVRSKESAALLKDSLNPYTIKGVIPIYSRINGIVLTLDHSAGDYLQEGDQMATIAVPSSYVFILEVPYELVAHVKLSSICDIFLPDGTSVSGTIWSRLPSMTPGSQTQRFIIHLQEPKNMTENLIARIRLVKDIIPNALLLNKSCILTDEVMKHFWVMKLINDTLAVKVPVTTGVSNGDEIQILSPSFSPNDQFLSSGNYGLGDTVAVSVTSNNKGK